MKVLWTLYQSLAEESSNRYHVYYHLVTLTGKTGKYCIVAWHPLILIWRDIIDDGICVAGQLATVYTDMATTRRMFSACKPALTTEQQQNCTDSCTRCCLPAATARRLAR